MPDDAALEALDALAAAIGRARTALDAMDGRAQVLRRERERGRTFADIVANDGHPLLVEMLTRLLEELSDAGSTFRRAEARALRDDGLSQDEIAAHFGVSRQRVGYLLQHRAHEQE